MIKLHVGSRATMAKKCTKKRYARAKLFCKYEPVVFLPFSLPSLLSLPKLSIVVIQKFWYHSNVTSHLSSLLDVFLLVPSDSPRRLCESLLDPVLFSVYRYWLVSLTFLFLLDTEFILPTALWFIQRRGGTTSCPNHPYIWKFQNLSQ